MKGSKKEKRKEETGEEKKKDRGRKRKKKGKEGRRERGGRMEDLMGFFFLMFDCSLDQLIE